MAKNEIIELSDRKRQILLGAVESYIDNALPITSEKVQSNLFTSLSSATLRNELSTLEEMGYLKQLHTSSGRVPTTKAYRYFVDNLMESQQFDKTLLIKVKEKFESRNTFLLDTIDSIAKKIGEIVEYPVFISMSGYEMLEIRAVNVIPLITGQALVLIQTSDGIINNTINLDGEINEEHCKDVSKFLTNNLMNRRLIDVIDNFDYYNDKFKTQIKYFNDFFSQIIIILNDYISKGSSKLVKGSTSNLLEKTQIDDLSKAKKFLSLVENETEIKHAIEKIDEENNEIVFSIGAENENEDMADYSIIKANYTLPSGITAHFGVVGPERMDYARIASALKFVVDEMNNLKGDNNDK